jgi:DMSO/TMAO reductase YedYZ molybdopterin-dependent catalytic subunit
MKRPIDIRRRQLLLSSAGAAAAAGLGSLSTEALAQASKPLPQYAAYKDASRVIVHSTNTIETKRSAFGTSVIVPAEILYVRNNLPAPEPPIVADRDAWEVSIEGVRNPRKITLGELKTIGIETVAMVLQCSGNGRAFFPHKASGTQWSVGAAGCLIWSGVPVAAVAEAMGGVADGGRFMTGTGGEKLPAGVDAAKVRVERSVPLKAMEVAMLAWEMNGDPVPLAHGGPLRLVIPGYYGINNVKYLNRLAFTEQETSANIQASGYRVRPIGQKGKPGQPSMWEMNVKSWINHPSGDGGPVRAGMVQINGVAFGGVNGLRLVEVSVDGGKTWNEARFVGPDLGRYAWRQFVYPVRLKSGSYTLVSRAVDEDGNEQPVERVENHRAYGHNGWRDHGVKITVS